MLKKIIRKLFLYAGPWSLLRTIERKKNGPGITILYGHRVMTDDIMSNPNDPRFITGHTSVSQVAEAIKELKKYYQIISMDEAVSQISKGEIKQESVVLTFDDGFRDNFINLLPVLKEHNVPATFYVNASVIDSKRNLWFQAVINFFFAIEENQVYVALNNHQYDLSTPGKRYQAAFHFMQFIQSEKKPEEFYPLIEALAGDKCLPCDEDIHMTWNDLRILIDEPLITLGAHSLRHFPLSYCEPQLAESEIIESISQLEENLGITINHFSYPRGHQKDFNAHHISVLQAKNIKSATTTLRGVNRRGQDLYSLKRVGFPQNISNDVDEFLWYVGGIPQLLEKLRA